MTAATMWPSAYFDCLGTPIFPRLTPRGPDYAAQWPTREYPCQRFIQYLTAVDA